MANYDFDASKDLVQFALRCVTFRFRSPKGFVHNILSRNTAGFIIKPFAFNIMNVGVGRERPVKDPHLSIQSPQHLSSN